MVEPKLHPWEPEETVGLLWHRLVSGQQRNATDPSVAVHLDAMRGRLGVLFRGLGGRPGIELIAAADTVAPHRRGFWRRLGQREELATLAAYDGERLQLPNTIAAFASREENEACFLWLAAFAANDHVPLARPADGFLSDVERLRHANEISGHVIARSPGLATIYQRLCKSCLAHRDTAGHTASEIAMEAALRRILGDQAPLAGASLEIWRYAAGERLSAPSRIDGGEYHPYKSVPLWPESVPAREPEPAAVQHSHEDGDGSSETGGRRKQAVRKKADQANRRDSLILNRFETILSWTEFLNINRRVEDDEADSARKAADDANEIAITEVDKRPATRLAFDLDMAPQDLDRAQLSDGITYPEWDYRANAYLANHAVILLSDSLHPDPATKPQAISRQARKRLNAVRRQFEALRPRRQTMTRQADGNDLDIDAVVRSFVDVRSSGSASGRVFLNTVKTERDLSVATLIDTSRSTEAAVSDRAVIEIARESLLALGQGLEAIGDRHAIYSFSSLRRDKVFVNRVKAFGEAMSNGVEARIAALRPGFYTRLGAAIRHTAFELGKTGTTRRLLLVLTDGKPNDLDHYEGRYGVEDSRKAVLEARRMGHAVFAIAIDRKAEQYVPRIFGQNGYSIVSHPEKLIDALPGIYKHLVT